MTLRDHLGPRTDENAALHDELDRLLAARAVALDEAAKEVSLRRHLLHQQLETLDIRSEDAVYAICEDAIRALDTTDSTAALDRVIRAHVEKALEMVRAGDAVEEVIEEPVSRHTYVQIRPVTADDVLREMGGRGNG